MPFYDDRPKPRPTFPGYPDYNHENPATFPPRGVRTIVPSYGSFDSYWAVVGERPGETEAEKRQPFVGASGKVQDRLLNKGGLHRRDAYFANLVQDYLPGNPHPLPEDIEFWSPKLLVELRRLKPRYIIAAGAHSTRFFLGDVTLEAVHGIPHHWSGPGIPECVILPCYHPAAQFTQPDLLPHIMWDYEQACRIIKNLEDPPPNVDAHPNPHYYDIADGVTDWYLSSMTDYFGMDTEGIPGAEWSIQVSVEPGTGLTLRRDHPNFEYCIKRLKKKLRSLQPTMVVHNCLYDLEMCQGLGIDFVRDLEVPIFDTMMAAYLMCLEPQSLKVLARRHCGMVMSEYSEVVGKIGVAKQLAYLEKVIAESWPKPEMRVKTENNGRPRPYTPQPVERRAEAILIDYYSGKTTKNGELVDPLKRWWDVDRELRRMVERKFGKMPVGTLADIPLKDAVNYASCDPDAVVRLYPKMKKLLEERDLTKLMAMKMRMIRAAAEMKITGILGRKSAFEALAEEMDEKKMDLSHQISKKYFGGEDFNPNSSPQTAKLMEMRGLVGEKKTKGGKMSTSKKSIEHLRFIDPAIELLEQWREHSKVKDSFATPVTNNWPDDPTVETVRIKCDLKVTRVTSGRFSAAMLDDVPTAPLLAIPVRSDLGKSVRNCYEAASGYVLASFDLDQAEMRLMADESRDSRLVRLFNDGTIDIHTDTASKIFKVPYDKVHKMKHRYPAKRVGFGVITGIQGPGLLDQLRMAGCEGWTVASASKLIEDWLDLYPGVAQYMEDCREDCRRNNGIIRDRWGMMRHLPAILNSDRQGKWDRLEAERQTHSHRIQGGAQGWLQNVMGWLWEELKPFGDLVRFLLQIHDELIFEVAEGLEEEVGEIIKEGMVNHGGTRLCVPVKSSGSFAKSWGKLKD